MSGAEKIKDKILEDARLQAEANIKIAEEEAENIIRAASTDAETKRKQIIEKAELEAVEVRKRLIAVAELEARKQKLKAKQEVVDEAFDMALTRLINLPDIEYQSILGEMILNSVETGIEEVLLSSKDKLRLPSGFIDDVNKKLVQRGLIGNLHISDETRNISGGFILKSGDVEINNSFEAIIRMKRDDIEAEVFKALF
ncbi:V-type ATP synthase subunit E [Acetivibrio cellulolyticus]|uniref:V-type ATP synthase subunit E n=1 Tax=Acetivibrio cellulolyticus TaxID=35830 RepID=UPI0001E30153|nr:V-type ATP synthase subunit E family protein [Acetivibrio cellulolyticus]